MSVKPKDGISAGLSAITNKNPGRTKYRDRLNYQLLYMTVPFFILTLVFAYLPLWGWSIAFVKYIPGVNILKSDFVGVKNFITLFARSSEFMMVMRNTLVLSVLSLATSPFVVLLAILMNEIRLTGYKRVLQTLTSIPNFISWVIVYSMFFSLLSVEDGNLNQLLLATKIVGKPIDYLGNPNMAWGLQTFLSFWKNAGWGAIIYLAAMAGIDSELYEAARIDGAGKIAQIRYITIPGIMQTYFVLLVLGIGNILSAGGFEQYFMFHNAMVHNFVEVLDTYTYRLGMVSNNFALSTAAGMFKTVVSILLLLCANGLHKKVMGYPIV